MLLDAGIDVLTTMNVQHLESLNDQIWQSTGVRVRETVPDWVVKQADDVVMVDLAPRALLNRLERGVVYPPDRVEAALKNFFVEPTLVALRELAIRHAAHAVESQYATRAGAAETRTPLGPTAAPDHAGSAQRGAHPARPSCRGLSRRRLSRGVRVENDRARASWRRGAQRPRTPAQFRARPADRYTVLQGDDVPESVVAYARLHHVTQIFVMREPSNPIRSWFASALVQRLVDLARDMQVTVVADRVRHAANPPA